MSGKHSDYDESKKRYFRSEKGFLAQKRWRLSEKGKVYKRKEMEKRRSIKDALSKLWVQKFLI